MACSSVCFAAPIPSRLPLGVCMQCLVEEGVVEKFIGLDMSDAETVFDRCLEAIKKVKKVGPTQQSDTRNTAAAAAPGAARMARMQPLVRHTLHTCSACGAHAYV